MAQDWFGGDVGSHFATDPRHGGTDKTAKDNQIDINMSYLNDSRNIRDIL